MELRLASVFILVLLYKEGLAQLTCYSSTYCAANTRIGRFSSVRECCEIEEALSHGYDHCGWCIIYGWDGNTTMEVKKGQQLNLKVGLLKGELSSRILLNFDYNSSLVSLNVTEIILGVTNSHVVQVIVNDDGAVTTKEVDITITIVQAAGGAYYTEVFYDEIVLTIPPDKVPTIVLSPERDILLEGIEGEFCLSVHNSDIDINVTISDEELSRMQEDIDIQDVMGNIILANDSTPTCMKYTVIDDTDMEGTETITMRWVGLEERVIPAEFTLVILDNDDCPELNVRLVGGNNSSGLVEVCHDFEWRSVCDDSWSSRDAKVVCKQLGFLPFIAGLMRRGKFEDEPVKYWLDDLQCRGNETSLFECKPNRVGEHNCRDNERAGVSCLSDSDVGIRLTSEGYIELVPTIVLSPERDILLEGIEGEFCLSIHNSDIDINVTISDEELSRMQEDIDIQDVMGNIILANDSTPTCMKYTVINDTEMEGTEIITVRWVGLEERVTPAEFTLVILDNDNCPELNVRLVGGDNSSGLVEVCHDFEWRSVCDDSWSSRDAKVVCRQLGFLPFIAGLMRRGRFEDEQPVKYWLDDLQCRGNETSLFECKPNRVGEHNCRDNERAGVSCLSDSDVGIRLTSEGYIELGMWGEWKAVCANFWSSNGAKVACRELGTPSTNTRLIVGPYKGRGWMDHVNCKGDEEHLFSCLHIGPNIPCRKRAGVRC